MLRNSRESSRDFPSLPDPTHSNPTHHPEMLRINFSSLEGIMLGVQITWVKFFIYSHFCTVSSVSNIPQKKRCKVYFYMFCWLNHISSIFRSIHYLMSSCNIWYMSLFLTVAGPYLLLVLNGRKYSRMKLREEFRELALVVNRWSWSFILVLD